MRRKSEEIRFFGPYKHRDKWRLQRRGGGQPSTWIPFDTEIEALRAKRAAERKLSTTGRTVEEAVTAYLEHLVEASAKPRTVKAATNFLAALLPDPTQPIGEIGPQHYEALRKRPGRKPGSKMAAATHQRALRAGRSFLAWCMERGWLRANALAQVKLVGKAERGKTQLTIDEARRWMAACEELAQEHVGALGALMCLQLALRVEEVCTRMVRHLDNGGTVLWVRGKGAEEDTAIALDGPKLAAEEREALRPLREQLRQRARGRFALQPLLEGVTPFAITYWTRKACDKAGVPWVCPHALRGMHSTFAREQGVTAGAISRTLRHSEAIDRQHYAAAGSTERGQRAGFFQMIKGGEERGTDSVLTVPQKAGRKNPRR